MIAFSWIMHTDGREETIPIEMHKCTDEDYKQFYEVDRKSENEVQRIKDADGWMCLNWNEERLKLFNGY